MPVAILSTKDNYETSGTTIKYDNVVYAIDINWNGAKLELVKTKQQVSQ